MKTTEPNIEDDPLLTMIKDCISSALKEKGFYFSPPPSKPRLELFNRYALVIFFLCLLLSVLFVPWKLDHPQIHKFLGYAWLWEHPDVSAGFLNFTVIDYSRIVLEILAITISGIIIYLIAGILKGKKKKIHDNF